MPRNMMPLIHQLLIVIALLSAISNQGKAVNEAPDATPEQANGYDVVVIGGGVAGLSTAMQLVLCQSMILGLDST